MKTIIIDDERLARREMRELLRDFPEIEIAGEAENCVAAAKLIVSTEPDLIFLDVQMRGETGFDLLEKIETARLKIVFVTAFDSFALRAFEVSALDYLLKPVNPERLRQTIEKLFEKTENKIVRRILEYDDRLFIESGARSQFLKINSISHIIAAGDYTEVFTLDRKKLLAEKSLREWETRLPEKHFARIHRGTIVNLESVERVETWFNRTFQIYLRQQTEPFAVSRRYAVKLKTKFG